MPYLKFLQSDKTTVQVSGNSYADFEKGKQGPRARVCAARDSKSFHISVPDSIVEAHQPVRLPFPSPFLSPALDKNEKIVHKKDALAWVKSYFLRREIAVKKQKAERGELPGANVCLPLR